MKDWNVVVTSFMHQENRLLTELSGLGDFHHSGFRETIIGRVADIGKFLEALKHRWDEQPFLPELLSSVVPVREVFPFTLENLLPKLQEKILGLGPDIGDAAFYVRMKRRGHKGELDSQQVEQALDQFLKEELEARGQKCRIDFDDPEVIVVVETIHNQCGLGLVNREMKERYPFIKIK
ncbi:MAG: THUMP domain-containing protein [Deltaproteobacteria bacterium]|nr:THUMP domain-containing protein [Deltaproteobacteria bacterium]